MSILSGRTITALLIGSVVLNLLFLGAILGRFLMGPPPLRSFPPTMGWVLRGLPPEEQATIRPLLTENMKRTMTTQRALADAQRKAARLLRADNLDENALNEAFAQLRDASRASQEAMHSTLIKVMKALTPEQRRQMLGYLRGGWRGEMRHRNGERRGPRPMGGDRMPPPPSPDEGGVGDRGR